MTPQEMIAALKAGRPKDWPRFALIHGAYDLPGGEVYLGGDLENHAEVFRRTDKGSINQRNGYLVLAYRLLTLLVRGRVVSRLRNQLRELLEGEFGSSGYAGHNRGWVLGLYIVASGIGDREVAELALLVMRACVSIERLHEAPPDAHPTLRGRSFLPGGRCADRRGVSKERDLARDMEIFGVPAPDMPKPDHASVEVWMVWHAVADGLLPKIPPGPIPSARWRLLTRKYAHGMEVSFPDGMPRSIGSLYGLSIDWRKPLLPDGVRGGAVEWVAWDEFAPAYKGSRPEGWDYPGGPMPRPLPQRDLGGLIGEWNIPAGGGGIAAPPEEEEEPTMPEKPTGPVNPDPTTPDRYEIEASSVLTGKKVKLLVGNDRDGKFTIFRETR